MNVNIHKSEDPTFAIIGCGAIVEQFYLPAFESYKNVCEKLIFVDIEEEHARTLATRYGSDKWAMDIGAVLDRIDGAIIATPHHLHAPIGLKCLEHGVHVLCEKPMAEKRSEAEKMVQVAERHGVKLAVNNTRRLFPAYKKVKDLIVKGEIGAPRHISYREGGEFSWPTKSGFYFTSTGSQRGVLLDRGAHVLDLICWWLDEKPILRRCRDDSFEGNEAVCHVEFDFSNGSGEVKLSWINKLVNQYRIEGEQGWIEGSVYDRQRLTVTSRSGKRKSLKIKSDIRTFMDYGHPIVSNFIDVVLDKATPLIPGSSVVNSIALIEECYSKRSRFRMPWYDNLEVV